MYCSPASTASPFYGSSNPAAFQDLQTNTSVCNAFSTSQTPQQQFQSLGGLDSSGVVSPSVVIGDAADGGSETSYSFAYPSTSDSSHPGEMTSSGSEPATFFQTKRFKVPPEECTNPENFPGLKSTNEQEIDNRVSVINCGDIPSSLPGYGLPILGGLATSAAAIVDQNLNSVMTI